MENICTKLALYRKENECARTDTLLFLISEVSDSMVSLIYELHYIRGDDYSKLFLARVALYALSHKKTKKNQTKNIKSLITTQNTSSLCNVPLLKNPENPPQKPFLKSYSFRWVPYFLQEFWFSVL